MKKLLQEIKDARVIKIIWPTLLSTGINLLFVLAVGSSLSYFLLGVQGTFLVVFSWHVVSRHRLLQEFKESLGETEKFNSIIGKRLDQLIQQIERLPGEKGGEHEEPIEPPVLH